MKKIVNYFKQLTQQEAFRFLIIFYLVGIAGFLIPPTRNIFEHLIPVSLLINVFLLFLFHVVVDKKHLIYFVFIVVFTFCVEAIGVNTGLLFGEYFYGNSLPIKFLGTPLIIGFNWLMISYGAVELLRTKAVLRKFSPILVGVLMVAFDIIMEPVAMKTDMWRWVYNAVPIQNYIMWFVVSVFLASGYELFNIQTSRIGGRIFILQLIFFSILNVFLP